MRFRLGPNSKTYANPLGPVGGAFAILVGLVLLGFGGWMGMDTYTLFSKGLHAEGKIAQVHEELEESTRRHNGHTTKSKKLHYSYTVSFTPEGAAPITFRDKIASNSQSYTQGQTVDVVYMLADPANTALINRGWVNWLFPGALGFSGLIGIACGVTAMRRS